jgi:Zn-dependent metalloprotease
VNDTAEEVDMRRILEACLGVLLMVAVVLPVGAQQDRGRAVDRAAVQQLASEIGTTPSVSEATGTVRFARVHPARAAAPALRGAARASALEKQQRVFDFLRRHGRAFGVTNPETELVLAGSTVDAQGRTHLAYRQTYNGLPVFGAMVRVHFDEGDGLSVVNGTLVPDVNVSASPARSAEDASRTAFSAVRFTKDAQDLGVRQARLLVYRQGLAKGVPGETQLAYEVEVTNGSSVREFVYVNAQTGKIIDQITGTPDQMNRRAFDAQGQTAPGPNYPATPFWVEGQPFPTGVTEADNMIAASGDVYGLFQQTFGRDSYDGAGATMDSIFNRGNGCPNASWNGVFISFCPGTTSDDVTAHEWGHAYTEYTHGLIYAWQPGALNESYSDIWGEVVDFINGRGTDSPGGLRTTGACSAFSPPRAQMFVNAPASVAGEYVAQAAAFGPALTPSGTTAPAIVGLDEANATGPSTTDACTALTNAGDVAGKIAIVDRGTCQFSVKVYNAQLAGAVGVIVANNAATGLPGMGAGTNAELVTIPSIGIGQADGALIRAQEGNGLNVTLRTTAGTADDSVRWLMGEDASAFNGALRDMWNPTCYSNPGKVTDTAFYVCSTADQGGVHTNSGVPNHAFALIVDGGSYNGRTVSGIGLTKAAHIYYRAQTVYQTPASNFADHADAIETSCTDLIGANLSDLVTGAPSGQMISAGDCAQVQAAALATELRTPPTFCNFAPLLAKNPPNRCGAETTQVTMFADDFEAASAGWTVSHDAVTADFTPRDWVRTSDLPRRAGSAFFAVDPPYGTCGPGGDESGVLYLASPSVTVPEGVADPLLTFDHWMASETGWDGGNLKISVNGGPWTLVAPADYTYNAYNLTLNSVAAGNTNPLAGQAAFSGADGGSVDGSWGRSHVRLAAYAPPGSAVRLRWDFGTDGCGGTFGWYVDDVTVYACTPNTMPSLNVSNPSIVEGNSGYSDGAFTISLSHAFAQPVTAKFKLVNGTAKLGSDFVTPSGQPGYTITIPALSTMFSAPVRVRGDRLVEGDETFFLNLLTVVNATPGAQPGTATIVDDDQ